MLDSRALGRGPLSAPGTHHGVALPKPLPYRQAGDIRRRVSCSSIPARSLRETFHDRYRQRPVPSHLATGLIPQIAIGIVCGILLASLSPEMAQSVSLLGQLFISALKAVAPVLVFILVAAAIAGHQQGQPTHIRSVLVLYLIGTLVAALVAVAASFVFPTTLALDAPEVGGNPPGGIVEILRNLLMNAVENPVNA